MEGRCRTSPDRLVYSNSIPVEIRRSKPVGPLRYTLNDQVTVDGAFAGLGGLLLRSSGESIKGIPDPLCLKFSDIVYCYSFNPFACAYVYNLLF